MKFTASIIIFFVVISSSDLKEEGRHHRPPYKPTRPPYRPPYRPPPSNGLLLPNAFKVLLLVYLASLAATLHFLNTNVNITSLSIPIIDLKIFIRGFSGAR